MNVLLLSLYHFEKLNDGYIYADLINEFVRNEHNVFAVSLTETARKESCIDESEGFKHIFVKTGKIQKTNKIRKAINLILMEGRVISSIKKFAGHVKFDLIVTMVSNLSFCKTVNYFADRDNAFVYMLMKDIFPHNAVDMKMLKENGIIYKHYKKLETKYYRISDKIGVISKANLDLLSAEVSAEKLEINPNSIIARPVQLAAEEKKELSEKYGLPYGKKILLYGGNLGKPQGVDFLIDCIKHNEQRHDTFILVCGNGTEYAKLQAMLDGENILNSKLFPAVSSKEFQKLIKISNIGLVFLNKDFTMPNYPSRVLSYLEGRLPILFAVDSVCDAGVEAEKAGYGFNCISGDLDKFYGLADKMLYQSDLKLMGEKGFDYLIQNFNTEKTYKLIMESAEKHVQG